MDLRKLVTAKPFKKFLVEIATIVIGILIAFFLNQRVDTLNWRKQTKIATEAMNAELMEANRDAYYRLAVRPCGLQKLQEIEHLLVASHEKGEPVPRIAPYMRPRRPWLTDAWDNSRALQIAGHMPTEVMMNYARAYFFARKLQENQWNEMQAVNDLGTLQINAGDLQPAERDRLFLALSDARAREDGNSGLAWLLITRSRPLGVELSDPDKQKQLEEARLDYGDCVVVPDLSEPPAPSDIASSTLPN